VPKDAIVKSQAYQQVQRLLKGVRVMHKFWGWCDLIEQQWKTTWKPILANV